MLKYFRKRLGLLIPIVVPRLWQVDAGAAVIKPLLYT